MAGTDNPSDKEPKTGLRGMRKRMQEQIERAEAAHKLQWQQRRAELANAGVRAYNQKKMSEAVRHFHTYLHILEDMKQVPEGGLRPSLFDSKKDIAELLLISGIYWDLAKLY